MRKVFITLRQEHSQIDLALPGDIPSQFLAQTLAKGLNISLLPDQLCSLEVFNGEEIIKISPARSLEEARIENGSFILLSVDNPSWENNAALVSSNGIRFPLKKAVILIGRPDPKNDIQIDVDLSPLDEKKVTSRRHALIRHEGKDMLLVDAESRNGTWVNEKKLIPGKPYILHSNDRVTFGNLVTGVSLIFLRE